MEIDDHFYAGVCFHWKEDEISFSYVNFSEKYESYLQHYLPVHC